MDGENDGRPQKSAAAVTCREPSRSAARQLCVSPAARVFGNSTVDARATSSGGLRDVYRGTSSRGASNGTDESRAACSHANSASTTKPSIKGYDETLKGGKKMKQ